MSGSDEGSEAGQDSSNLTEANTEETFCSGVSQKFTCDNPSDNALTNEAYLFMKKMLPSYIVNCFMTTGYDTLDVLAEINDESLAEIEEIVNNEYPNESCFRHQPIPTCFLSSNAFKF